VAQAGDHVPRKAEELTMPRQKRSSKKAKRLLTKKQLSKILAKIRRAFKKSGVFEHRLISDGEVVLQITIVNRRGNFDKLKGTTS